MIDSSGAAAWLLADGSGEALSAVWCLLEAKELLAFVRSGRELWRGALELLPSRMPKAPPPFAMLTFDERARVLRFTPVLDASILFENFATWGPTQFASLHSGGALSPAWGGGQVVSARGSWQLGRAIDALPRMARTPSGLRSSSSSSSAAAAKLPLSHWGLQMANEELLTNLAPSGLVFRFGEVVRPRLLVYRCRATASRPYRAGAVLALAGGLGNDKGPERTAVFVSFVRDREDRCVFASRSATQMPVGRWRDGDWLTLRIRLDWDRKLLLVECRTEEAPRTSSSTPPGDAQEAESAVHEVPFSSSECSAVGFLMLYNQTCDFEACWTDLLLL